MRQVTVISRFTLCFAVACTVFLSSTAGWAQSRGSENSPAVLPRISERALSETGIRQIEGKYLTLYTDLAAGLQVDALPGLFDQAVGEWAKYFGVQPKQIGPWRMQGFLIKDREKFRTAGLIPESIPNFRNGYSTARQLWVMEQPSDYYRRHLLLHEGTHGFMYQMLGGCGAPWHMEGMAEMLATHRLADGRLQLGYLPTDRREVPMLGRIKLVQDRVKAKGVLPIRSLLKIDNRQHLENESYAWSWALIKFLDTHPRYQKRFRTLQSQVTKHDFSEKFLRSFQNDWRELEDEWRLFVGSLVHGHDIKLSAVTFRVGEPLGAEPAIFSLQTDRGWQSTGVRLAKGQRVRIEAQGRYQIARTSKAWWCEANGVTIRYHAGQPLGLLQAAIRPIEHETVDQQSNKEHENWILQPLRIGSKKSITANYEGTLYLRVNDSPAELRDNVGRLEVTIRAE